MEDKVERLRRNYEGFKRGEEDVLAVRDEAWLILEDVRKREDSETLEEVEDRLVDLEFFIEENRCTCHHKCSSC